MLLLLVVVVVLLLVVVVVVGRSRGAGIWRRSGDCVARRLPPQEGAGFGLVGTGFLVPLLLKETGVTAYRTFSDSVLADRSALPLGNLLRSVSSGCDSV